MFIERLRALWANKNTLVCVGLDPEPSRFPARFQGSPTAILDFNRAIIDATADLVCAYKPQIAHYAAHGAEEQLLATIDYIQSRHPDVLTILDAKRGDIGSTAEMYAREAFERYHADAVTVNPYLGTDTLEPFLKRGDKGVIVLCRTSNPGAGTFQDLNVEGEPLFRRVAEIAARQWNANGNVMLVVGATYPAELRGLRELVGDVPFLVPGVGAQGGSVEDAVRAGRDANGGGLVVSSSRAVLYASAAPDFAHAARAATEALRNEINRFRHAS